MSTLRWVLLGLVIILILINLNQNLENLHKNKKVISKDKLAYTIGKIRGLCNIHNVSDNAYNAIVTELRKLYHE